MTPPTCLGCFFDNDATHAMDCPTRLRKQGLSYRLGWRLASALIVAYEAGAWALRLPGRLLSKGAPRG